MPGSPDALRQRARLGSPPAPARQPLPVPPAGLSGTMGLQRSRRALSTTSQLLLPISKMPRRSGSSPRSEAGGGLTASGATLRRRSSVPARRCGRRKGPAAPSMAAAPLRVPPAARAAPAPLRLRAGPRPPRGGRQGTGLGHGPVRSRPGSQAAPSRVPLRYGASDTGLPGALTQPAPSGFFVPSCFHSPQESHRDAPAARVHVSPLRSVSASVLSPTLLLFGFRKVTGTCNSPLLLREVRCLPGAACGGFDQSGQHHSRTVSASVKASGTHTHPWSISRGTMLIPQPPRLKAGDGNTLLYSHPLSKG